MAQPPAGYLLLEDGARFDGEALHGEAPSLGEAVFNTSHTGYQEILTDPSYHRQIITFTAPHIGNVGINAQDVESEKVHAAGAVVRSLAPRPSNWRSEGGLADWLSAHGRCLLSGAETRAITLHLREHGSQRAGIFPSSTPVDEALEQVKGLPEMAGTDLAREVTTESAWTYNGADLDERWHPKLKLGEGLRIAVVDFGVKRNILRELARRRATVEILPAMTSAEDILKRGCHGVLLSNGPGDPAAVTYGIETTRALLGKLPLFGICLGHQILSLAAGLDTFKLRFGHRGANHPVRREEDKTVEITSQNHGFAVVAETRLTEQLGHTSETRLTGQPGHMEKLSLRGTAAPKVQARMSEGRAIRQPTDDEAISNRLASLRDATTWQAGNKDSEIASSSASWRTPRNDTFETNTGLWVITHINLNDGTVEGLAHRELPAFSIQYHPEASPGPHEGWVYFDRFMEMCRRQSS
ncbi:MAG: glutamine-hydrolyzing carbamoyl-phosphate synthase small subunit [bacterium]